MTPSSYSEKSKVQSFLENEFLFEQILRQVYKTQVLFDGLVQEVSREVARILGKKDLEFVQVVRRAILSDPFRGKFISKLARIANSG